MGGYGCIPVLCEIANPQAQLGHTPKVRFCGSVGFPPAPWGIPRAAIAAAAMASTEDSSTGAGTFLFGRPAGVGAAAPACSRDRGPGSKVRRADAGGRSSGAARGARRVRRRGLARGRAGRRSEGKLIADLSGGCGSEQDTMHGPGTRPTAAGH